MKLVIVGLWFVCASFGEAHAQASCADAIKDSPGLELAGTERIEGGTKCLVKAKGSKTDTPSVHSIIWDPPIIEDKEPKKPDDDKSKPPKAAAAGCEATEALLGEMWQAIATARANPKSTKPSGQQTYAVAFLLDDKCQYVTRWNGEFTANGVHAEGNILDQIKTSTPAGKQIKSGHWVFWMVDQVPCTHPQPKQPPPGGYCTKRLKLFAQQRKVGQRVFVAGKVKGGKLGSPKTYAQGSNTPTAANFMELTELTFKPPT